MKTILTLLCALTIMLSSPVVWAQPAGPTEQLRPALDELINILEDESLQGRENRMQRRQKIMETIKTGFDFKEMSKRVLGQTWNSITPEERDNFVELMTKLLENVYIGKLESYSVDELEVYTGQTIEFVEERVKGKRAQVTTLIEHQGKKLPVHYIMQREIDRWMVYDINIEGVSLIRNYMEQFKSIIREKQFAGLVETIEEKNRSFEQNGNGI